MIIKKTIQSAVFALLLALPVIAYAQNYQVVSQNMTAAERARFQELDRKGQPFSLAQVSQRLANQYGNLAYSGKRAQPSSPASSSGAAATPTYSAAGTNIYINTTAAGQTAAGTTAATEKGLSFRYGTLYCDGIPCNPGQVKSITGDKARLASDGTLYCVNGPCSGSQAADFITAYNNETGTLSSADAAGITAHADRLSIAQETALRNGSLTLTPVESRTLAHGNLAGGTIYTDGKGNYFVSKDGACASKALAQNCYSFKVRKNGVDITGAKPIDETIALANAAGAAVNTPPMDTACHDDPGMSDGDKTVQLCNGGRVRKITYANGAVETQQMKEDGTFEEMGNLAKFKADGSVDRSFNWKKDPNLAAQKGQCKVGSTIDGKRFDCTFSDSMVKGGELVAVGAQTVGSMAIYNQGQEAWNNVAAQGGRMDVVYDQQANLMESSGDTQRKMGAINLISGMGQMLASTKALKAKADLEKSKQAFGIKNEKITRAEQGHTLNGDGTVAGDDGHISASAIKEHVNKKGKAEDINAKVVTNFDLNSVSKLSLFGMNDVRGENNPTKMREAEIALKEKRIAANAQQILQSAIQEQVDAAGRALAGGIKSATIGIVQRRDGKNQQETAGYLRTLADSMRTMPGGPAALELENRSDSSVIAGANRNSAIVGSSEGPQVSPQNEKEVPFDTGGLGAPYNPNLPNNDPGVGPMGYYSPYNPLDGSGGGAASDGGGGFGPAQFSPPEDHAAQSAALLTPLGPMGPVGEMKDLKGYGDPGPGTAPGGSASGGGDLGDLVKSLLREDGAGQKVEDPRDLNFAQQGSRAPASDDAAMLDAGTDLFKQVSSAYRSKTVSGAVGIGPKP